MDGVILYFPEIYDTPPLSYWGITHFTQNVKLVSIKYNVMWSVTLYVQAPNGPSN